METKRLILFMIVGMLFILTWNPAVHFIGTKLGYTFPPPPETKQPAQDGTLTSDATTQPEGSTTAPTTSAIVTTTNVGSWRVPGPTSAPRVETIGSATYKDPAYAVQLQASERGAGIEQIALNDYYLTLYKKEPFTFEKTTPGPFADRTRPLAIRAVVINGTTIDLTKAQWRFVGNDSSATTDPSQQAIVFELPIEREGKPGITLKRSFMVHGRTTGGFEADGNKYDPQGFEVGIKTSITNHTDEQLNIGLKFNAPGVPPTEAERYADGNFVIGWAKDGRVAPTAVSTDSIKTQKDLLSDADGHVPYWFGATTTYFMAIHRFEPASGDKSPVDWYAQIDSQTLTPDAWGIHRQNEVVIVTKPAAVAPSSEVSIASSVYFGPKKREILTSPYYMLPWVQYDRALVIIGWFCGFCTWQWLIDVLFVVLKFFHAITRDWGLAIIGLVILVRLLLHPISKRAQLNMLKFGKLAPEMERIKKKYADDQETMNREMMKFYREHGATQVMGCLPMFLQMPVWIALWQAMNTTFDLRHEPFFYGLTWISDLSKPDHLIDFAKFGWEPFRLPLLSFVIISGVNILPLLFGILQFIQFKIQPKPPTMTPEQAQQQKMTQWMILILMPFLLYSSPSGLMIYMITSFLLGIFESKLVKKQFEEMEKNAAKFTVVDEDSPAAAGAQKATVRRAEPKGQKKGGLRGIIEEARRRAQEMQADIEKNRKKK